jgi:23S rRNA (adenine2503-C2)-methyltransferase
MANPVGDGPTALTDLTFSELQALLASWGEPGYRARQIRKWLYQALVEQPAQMTDLPEKLRQRLAEATIFTALRPVAQQESPDRQTEKVLFELRDSQTIESVLMRYEARQTVCSSTQVGCPVGCPFCATGLSGLVRNLSSGEIVDQVLHFARTLKTQNLRVSNVVFMGMGEPFLNYEAVWKAIETLNNADGFGLGARHLTVSTIGIVPCIKRMAEEKLQVGLAVSLHAADDALRNKLVPINRKYPLDLLIPACRDYATRTSRRVTFEYALIDHVNDDPAQARQLASLLKGMLCHVNLIPLNPSSGCAYAPSPRARTVAFQQELKHRGIANSLRLGRGIEIKAGCGELRSRQAQEYR